MAWIEITEADVLTVLSGDELALYRDAALGTGQADPVAPTIAQVVGEVRGYVAGCKAYVLGPEGTIPEKLLGTALDLVAVRIPRRVNKSPKEGRKDAAEAAIKRLEQVAAGRFGIEEPLVPAEEQAATTSGTPSISARPRRNVRREQDGW